MGRRTEWRGNRAGFLYFSSELQAGQDTEPFPATEALYYKRGDRGWLLRSPGCASVIRVIPGTSPYLSN